MKKVIFTLSATIAIAFFSCKKENTEPNVSVPITPKSSIGSFFSQNGAPVQTFTIDPTTFQTITGSGGTVIYFYQNSLVTEANQPVTGNVTIELREIFSKKDMILSKAPTTSGGRPLISGGEIFLSAKQNGQKLKISGSSYVTAQVPAGQNPSFQMREFYARNLNGASDWDSTTSVNPIQVMQDSLNPQNFYSFQVDSMNWINCDYFYSVTGPNTNVLATVGNDFDTANCYVFVSFNGLNSASHCYAYSNHIFSPGSYYKLPLGLSVTFVAIAEKNGQFYSSFKSATIANNHNEILTLTPTTEAQIKQTLASLP